MLSPDKQVDVVKLSAPGLVGESLPSADVRRVTGCMVVAAERDGELLTDPSPSFTVREGDRLVVAGTDDAVAAFNSRFR